MTASKPCITDLLLVHAHSVICSIKCFAFGTGRTNDKTGARTHHVLMGLQNRTLYADIDFELYDKNGVLYKEKGPYSITDGGYHHWRAMQFPAKYPAPGTPAAYQSKRLESVRKDSECTFGRSLKGRCRMLADRVRFHDISTIDACVHVACMLHNMQLRYDNLDTIGCEAGHWMQPNFEVDEVRMRSSYQELPNPMPSDTNLEPNDKAERDPEWSQLRDKLVTHFGVAFKKHEIGWRQTAVSLGRGLTGEQALFTASRGFRMPDGTISYGRPPAWDDNRDAGGGGGDEDE